jgi:Fe-S-cluster containining protein
MSDQPLRNDLDAGLRFLQQMATETKLDVHDLTIRLFALLEEMKSRGQLDTRSFDERAARLKKEDMDRLKRKVHVVVSNVPDKYTLAELPEIDCASLLPLCKGRCCRLNFALSMQDLEEGVVKFNYGAPYYIRKRPDSNYCGHIDPSTLGCTIYDKRPAICRTFDCRNDKRIWIDFEKRIPAPDGLVDGMVDDDPEP